MATLTVKEIAEKIGTTPRTLRKFLRSEIVENGGTIGEDSPGKGGRYSFEAKEFRGLAKRFSAWSAAKEVSTDENEESEDEVTDEVTEDEELDELEV